jgi:hypothetical protein
MALSVNKSLMRELRRCPDLMLSVLTAEGEAIAQPISETVGI